MEINLLSVASFVSIFSHSAAAAKLLQLCLTLCDPVDGIPPGSSVPGILQARILEWVYSRPQVLRFLGLHTNIDELETDQK